MKVSGSSSGWVTISIGKGLQVGEVHHHEERLFKRISNLIIGSISIEEGIADVAQFEAPMDAIGP